MRPVRLPEDLAVIDDLLAACRLADGHAAVGEHKYLSLLSGSGAKAAFVEEEDERVVSYLHLSENADAGGWTFESAVHPGFRTVDRLQAVVEQAIEEATERGGVTLRTWIYNATWPASLAALGFHADRELRQLRIRLPVPEPEYPPQIRIAPFRPGIDEAAWLAVNNEAFAGHPENGSWTPEILADRQAQAWWDPAGVLMAWDDSALVGFCWTKDHGDGVGEIYIIAVRPDAQRMGLGRALTLGGLGYLSGRGCWEGMLYVDAANSSAVELYDSMGFILHHVDQSMIARLR